MNLSLCKCKHMSSHLYMLVQYTVASLHLSDKLESVDTSISLVERMNHVLAYATVAFGFAKAYSCFRTLWTATTEVLIAPPGPYKWTMGFWAWFTRHYLHMNTERSEKRKAKPSLRNVPAVAWTCWKQEMLLRNPVPTRHVLPMLSSTCLHERPRCLHVFRKPTRHPSLPTTHVGRGYLYQ